MEHHDLNLMDEALGFHSGNKVKPSSSSWPLCGRFVLIEDCVDTSGAFVLHHILKRSFSYYPSSSAVVFLAFAHPFSHYDRILRKLGCNLTAQRDNGRFFFIDMLMLQCPGEKISYDGLAAVFEKTERVFSALHPENMKSVTVVLDDISYLEVAANGSSDDVSDFLHYCHTLTSEHGCAFVVLNHKDIYSSGDRPPLILEMEYRAEILVKVDPLATGLAKDVHGQVMVLNKETQQQHGISSIKVRNFHFKIKENNVEYFYPGTKT